MLHLYLTTHPTCSRSGVLLRMFIWLVKMTPHPISRNLLLRIVAIKVVKKWRKWDDFRFWNFRERRVFKNINFSDFWISKNPVQRWGHSWWWFRTKLDPERLEKFVFSKVLKKIIGWFWKAFRRIFINLIFCLISPITLWLRKTKRNIVSLSFAKPQRYWTDRAKN